METKDQNIGTYVISNKALEDIASIVCENTKNVYPAKKDKGFVEAKINKDEELKLYLEGRELKTALPDHYYQITYKGYSLGFGKCAKGIMKNKYPKGLRRVI